MSTVRRPDHRSEHRAARGGHATGLRHVLTHLITPLLMCIGMGLAYLGAFAHPAPHHLPVAVVGQGRSAQLLAQSINDKAGGDLDVRAVGDRSAAVDRLKHQDIFGAYVIPVHGAKGAAGTADASGAKGTLRGADGAGEAGAASALSASAGTSGAGGAAGPGKPAPELLVADRRLRHQRNRRAEGLHPDRGATGRPAEGHGRGADRRGRPDRSGHLLPAGRAQHRLVRIGRGDRRRRSRAALRLRAALALGTSFVVGLIGTAFAGPVFHLVDHGLGGLWGMAWLYSAGILLIGTGLHTFLRRWTTLGVMTLFVMLNFTSSGGIFRPEMQNGFFAALHSFWNGAGFVEGTRSHVYFDGYGLSGHV